MDTFKMKQNMLFHKSNMKQSNTGIVKYEAGALLNFTETSLQNKRITNFILQKLKSDTKK